MSDNLPELKKTELMILNNEVKKRQEYYQNLLVGGKKKIFTPEQLKDHAIEYFKYCTDNPIRSNQLITSGQLGGTVVAVDKPRMFTVEGFCLWCGINTKYLYQLDEQVRDKNDEESLRYSYIISYIRETIRSQRFELAAVNEINPMFVSKLEGLTDKVEHSGEVKNTVTHIEFVQRSIEDTTFTEVSDVIEEL